MATITKFENLFRNLVAWYRLDDDANTTNIIDSWGDNTGTYNGQNTDDRSVPGIVNTALNFTGTPDYIDTNQTFDPIFQSDFMRFNFYKT